MYLISNKELAQELKRISQFLGERNIVNDNWLLYYVVKHLNGNPVDFDKQYYDAYSQLVSGFDGCNQIADVFKELYDGTEDRPLVYAVAITLLDSTSVVTQDPDSYNRVYTTSAYCRVVKEIFSNLITDSAKLFPDVKPDKKKLIDDFIIKLQDKLIDLPVIKHGDREFTRHVTNTARRWLYNTPLKLTEAAKDLLSTTEPTDSMELDVRMLVNDKWLEEIIDKIKGFPSNAFKGIFGELIPKEGERCIERFVSILKYSWAQTLTLSDAKKNIDTFDLYNAGLISQDEI